MNICVNGSRDFTDEDFMVENLNWLINYNHLPHESNWVLVLGGAKGADFTAYNVCEENSIPCIIKYAEWDVHGKRAGYIRNQEMLDISEVLVSFWNGTSKGTKHMIDISLKKGIPVHVFNTGDMTHSYYLNGKLVWSSPID